MLGKAGHGATGVGFIVRSCSVHVHLSCWWSMIDAWVWGPKPGQCRWFLAKRRKMVPFCVPAIHVWMTPWSFEFVMMTRRFWQVVATTMRILLSKQAPCGRWSERWVEPVLLGPVEAAVAEPRCLAGQLEIYLGNRVVGSNWIPVSTNLGSEESKVWSYFLESIAVLQS